MKIRKHTILMVILAIGMYCYTVSFAKGDELQKEQKSSQEKVGITGENDDSETNTRLVMREYVRYDPTLNQINYKYHYLGMVFGNNTSSYIMHISYEYETSGSITTTLEGNISVSSTIDAVIAEVSVDTGFSLARTRSWTQGASTGATLDLPPHTAATISAYIPGMGTEGSLVYYAYPDSYYPGGWYEYVDLSKSYIPLANAVYLEANDW